VCVPSQDIAFHNLFFRNFRASVLLISRENISLPAILVNGVSVPRACAIPVSEEERKGDINLNENKY
jgi:hypothetical protein